MEVSLTATPIGLLNKQPSAIFCVSGLRMCHRLPAASEWWGETFTPFRSFASRNSSVLTSAGGGGISINLKYSRDALVSGQREDPTQDFMVYEGFYRSNQFSNITRIRGRLAYPVQPWLIGSLLKLVCSIDPLVLEDDARLAATNLSCISFLIRDFWRDRHL